ncbi:MAG: hypothetical protein PHI66_00780 [Candidatus Pacebacteria bacterium]|nr:hypothetical protein [Candidatus Paceibacterota bacterium]
MDFKLSRAKIEEFFSVIITIVAGFFTVAFFKLNNSFAFFNLDEMLWHSRSKIFWDKMLNYDFSGLIQSAQPGITVYWFAGFLVRFIDNFDPYRIKAAIAEKEAIGLDFNFINENNQALYAANRTISFVFNVPLILDLFIFFILFYYLLRKVGFNKIISYFSLFFLSTNIYLAYWTTPSDKMLNIFMTLSFLCFLVFILEKGGRKYFYLSAVLGALAVLSKLSALFLFPFYLMISLIEAGKMNKEKIICIFKDYSLWLSVFVVVCVIFLPTIIFFPGEVYNLVFHPSNTIYETGYAPLSYLERLWEFFNLFVTLIITSNLATASSIFFLVFLFMYPKRRFSNFLEGVPDKTVRVMSAYFLLFCLMVTIISNNHDIRFMAPAFVIMSVFSAIGLYMLAKFVTNKLNISEKMFYLAAVAIITMANMFSLITSGSVFEDAINKYFNLGMIHL